VHNIAIVTLSQGLDPIQSQQAPIVFRKEASKSDPQNPLTAPYLSHCQSLLPAPQGCQDVVLHAPVEYLQALQDQGGAEVTPNAAGVAVRDLRAHL
jgi:hypothetical protein